MNLEDLRLQYPEHYYLKTVHEACGLLIAFGNAGSLNGKFPFYKTFDKFQEYSYLLISGKDKNAWYSNGLPGLGQGLRDSLCGLSSAVLEYSTDNGIDNVFVTGASMGGFPALLFSHFTGNYAEGGGKVKGNDILH